jgi:hypothetical protein
MTTDLIDVLGECAFEDGTPIPLEITADMREKGYRTKNTGDGIDMIDGHDQGVAYMFEWAKEWNPRLSDEKGYEYFDEFIICKWLRDKRMHPTCRIEALPPALLKFDRQGNVVGGSYYDAFKRFLKGGKVPGHGLDKWDVLSVGQVASLNAIGIYTVEQFAESPREKFEGIYPIEFIEAHKRAQQWVNGRELIDKGNELDTALKAQQKQNEELQARIDAMEAQLAKSKAKSAPKRKSKTKTKAKSRSKKPVEPEETF